MSRPVRVLWLSKGLGPGGAERLLVSLARTIDPVKVELHAAYLLPGKAHLASELEAAGVETTCLDGESAFDVRWLSRLRRLVKVYRPDVVHSHSPQPAALARPLVRAQGTHRPALAYTEHNSWDGYRMPTRMANAATWALDDYHLAVSRTAFDSIPPFLNNRTEVLVHGVDLAAVRAHTADRDRVRRELGLSDGEILVVTVANLRQHKDYPTLLEAARIVTDSGVPVRFVAVGQGPLEPAIRAHSERLRLGDAFRLLGYRTDVLDLMAAADIFCLSSIAEGYPVSLMEALALGKPVVATSVGGVQEAVRNGVEGLLVPPRAPDRLAAALVALQDRGMRTSMGDAARDRSAEYDIHRAAERHERLYMNLAADRNFARP